MFLMDETIREINTSKSWYQREVTDISEELGTDLTKGLTQKEAEARLLIYGANSIRVGKRVTLWAIILRQFSNPLSLVLIVAGLLTIILGKYSDFAAMRFHNPLANNQS